MFLGTSSLLSGTEQAFGASSVQDRLNQATKNKKAAQEARNASKEQLKGAMAQVTKLDNELEIINAELSAIDDIIREADEKIAAKEAEIADYEKRIAEQDESFRSRLRVMDETGTTDYIDLLLNADSLSDFVDRVETIREITEFDQGIINEMKTLKKGVEDSKNEVLAYRNEQQEARDLVKSKQNEANAKLAEKQSYVKSLEKDIAKYDQLYEAARREEDSLKRSIASSSSRGTVNSGQNRIIYSGGVFCWPAPSYTYISSPFGYRIHPVYGTKKYHSGLDLAAPGGSPILAAANGTVKFSGWNGGYGYCVIIDHGNGIQTLYGHSSKLLVSAGQSVTRGQTIALVGTTGTSTGNHLHFEVLNNGSPTDPMPYLK
ncbi:MAG: peptidoglycan DD-metalloendopeptidase family protein [Clostridia bacterium]|nr:peptidoglycan DD-metalloendopeptidase family protein [Clostridia bacterium]